MTGDAPDDEVTPRQAKALAALITSATAKAAAKAAGVDVKTLRKWMAQPAFRRRHRAARNAVVDDAVLVLQKCAVEAATVLRACLKAASPGVRCRAAQLILGTAIEVQGLLDMAEDLDALNLKIDTIAAAKGKPDAPGSPTTFADRVRAGQGGDRPASGPQSGLVPGGPPPAPIAAPDLPGGASGVFSGTELGTLFDDP